MSFEGSFALPKDSYGETHSLRLATANHARATAQSSRELIHAAILRASSLVTWGMGGMAVS